MLRATHTKDVAPSSDAAYWAAPSELNRGPSLIGAMLADSKHWRGTPTPGTEMTPDEA